MPTVKISELPEIYHLSTNTEATLVVGVDLETGTTGKINVATFGEGLYAYQPLKVGQNQVLFSNTIGQFSGNSNTYLQINNQNFNSNGSSDYVASASDSDNTNKYIDLGINGSTFNDPNFTSMHPYDGYLYTYGASGTSTSGNLVIGTASSFANIVYIVGGTVTNNIVARMTKTDLQLSANYNIKFGDGSVQSVASSPANYSQASFALANNNLILAQAAFDTANTASANTVLSQGTNVTQNTRITVIEGVNLTQNTNLAATDSKMNSAFGQANTGSVLAQAAFNQANVTIGVDASQNTRMVIIEGVDVSQNARMTIIEGTDTTQNTAIAATDNKMQNAYNTANNAFVKANNALANTTGTFDGSLTITANLFTTGIVSVNNSTFSSDSAMIRLTASDNFVVAAPSNTNYMLHVTGKANSVTRVVLDSFGANTYPLIAGRMGRGSAAAPAAASNNDVLMRIAGQGHTGSSFVPSSPTKIDFVAAENFSTTNRGTRIEFWNTPNGSNTISRVALFNANTVEFLGSVNPQKGFIYSPNVITSGATTLTIDFNRDSLIKANSSGGITVSFTNYVAGKEVVVWFQNQSGSTQTVTHGCLANNSTTGGTSFTVPGSQTVLMRYFSIDAGSSDVYVAVTK